MEGPFDFEETIRLEDEFDDIVRQAKRDQTALLCEFCGDYLRPQQFTKEGFVETSGKLICDVCC